MRIWSVIADVMAVLGLAYAGYMLLAGIRSALEIAFPPPPDPAGLGAVSAGISEAVVLLAPAVASNVLLARWARRAGSRSRSAHTAHAISLLVLPIAAVLLVLASAYVAATWVNLVLGTLPWGAQFVLLIVLLVMFLMRSGIPGARGTETRKDVDPRTDRNPASNHIRKTNVTQTQRHSRTDDGRMRATWAVAMTAAIRAARSRASRASSMTIG